MCGHQFWGERHGKKKETGEGCGRELVSSTKGTDLHAGSPRALSPRLHRCARDLYKISLPVETHEMKRA